MQKAMQKAGLIGLVLTMSLLTACGNVPKEINGPEYTPEQTEAIIEDGKTCGPAAQEALFDLCVMIDC